MNTRYLFDAIGDAFGIIASLEPDFIYAVFLSLTVAITSTVLAGLAGVPLGIWIGTGTFRGKKAVTLVLNTLLSLPTVLIGLLVYSVLSWKGPLGRFNLLFTPAAMVLGQFVFILPIITALVAGGIKDVGDRPLLAARMLGAGKRAQLLLYLRETRFIVLTGVLTGFGRAFTEVGISIMVGGNIRLYTRSITTAIVLETSKGNFGIGIALGFIMLTIALLITVSVQYLQGGRT